MPPLYYNTRACWLALALLAILVRGLVPIGYMPDFGTHRGGMMPLRICTGDGFAAIDVPTDKYGMPGKSAPGGHSNSHHTTAPCDFAIGHVLGFEFGYAALFVFLAFALLGLFESVKFSILPCRYFGDMAARAPPLFS